MEILRPGKLVTIFAQLPVINEIKTSDEMKENTKLSENDVKEGFDPNLEQAYGIDFNERFCRSIDNSPMPKERKVRFCFVDDFYMETSQTGSECHVFGSGSENVGQVTENELKQNGGQNTKSSTSRQDHAIANLCLCVFLISCILLYIFPLPVK